MAPSLDLGKGNEIPSWTALCAYPKLQSTPNPLNMGVWLLTCLAKGFLPSLTTLLTILFRPASKNVFPLAVASSILALYLLPGHPAANHRNPVSWELIVAKVTHCCQAKGFIIDTRAIEVSIPGYKWDQVVKLLATWTTRESYTILEAAELLGLPNNLSEICCWARPLYFALQNDVRQSLQSCYYALQGWHLWHAKQIADWEKGTACRFGCAIGATYPMQNCSITFAYQAVFLGYTFCPTRVSISPYLSGQPVQSLGHFHRPHR